MTQYKQKLIVTILQNRSVVVAVVCILTALGGWFAKSVTFDTSLDIWFFKNDPNLKSYKKFLKRFQIDQTGVVGVFSDNIFTPSTLSAIKRITHSVEQIPHIKQTRSLTNLRVIESGADSLDMMLFIQTLPTNAAEGRALRQRAQKTPLVRGHYVSADGRATAITFSVAPQGNTFLAKQAIVEALNHIAHRESGPTITVRVAGDPSLAMAMLDSCQRDLKLLGPATILIVGLIVFLLYRRVVIAIIPLAVVIISLVWTFGLMGLLAMKINAISTALVALVLSVGVADAIHIISHYSRKVGTGQPIRWAIEHSLSITLVPCFYTTITTVGALLSLLVSDLKPVRDFGWLAATGVSFAFFLSITFVPAMLHFVRPIEPIAASQQQNTLLDRIASCLGTPSLRRSRVVFVVSIMLFIGSVITLGQLDVGSNPIGYLSQDNPTRKDIEAIEGALGGSISLEFMINAPHQGLKNPYVLRRIDRFQRWLIERPGISSVISIVDPVKEVYRALKPESSSTAPFPQSKEALAQLYLLLEGEDMLQSMMRSNYSASRISARVTLSGAQMISSQLPLINAKIAQMFDGDALRMEMTGLAKMFANLETYLLSSQIKSFIVAFSVMIIFLLLLFRSAHMVLFALIPNITPVVMGLAFMVIAGISLDPGTVMIGSIALGIVVDDTVHFLIRFQNHIRVHSLQIKGALYLTMTETCRPIMATSFVLAAGFIFLSFGKYSPNVHFGTVSATIIVIALAADLVLLPAALLVIRPKF